MTTLYTQLGGAGPWACDDDNVTADGYLYNGAYIAHAESDMSGPTVDGRTYQQSVAQTGGRVRNAELHGGLMQGTDSSHGVFAPNASATVKGSDHR